MKVLKKLITMINKLRVMIMKKKEKNKEIMKQFKVKLHIITIITLVWCQANLRNWSSR